MPVRETVSPSLSQVMSNVLVPPAIKVLLFCTVIPELSSGVLVSFHLGPVVVLSPLQSRVKLNTAASDFWFTD